MRFVETPVFTKQVVNLLSDEEYRELQLALVLRPDQGSVIPGGGGMRKLRWRAGGKGKRGGARVIYYWYVAEAVVYMLDIYVKSGRDDLRRQDSSKCLPSW